MKVLALGTISPGMTKQQIEPYMKDEAARGMQLFQQGIIRETYQRQDQPGVVMMLESASVQEAREALESLPLRKAGITQYVLIPLLPTG